MRTTSSALPTAALLATMALLLTLAYTLVSSALSSASDCLPAALGGQTCSLLVEAAQDPGLAELLGH